MQTARKQCVSAETRKMRRRLELGSKQTYIEETVQLLNHLPFLIVEDVTTKSDASALDLPILRACLLLVELRHVAELREDVLHIERAFQDTCHGVPAGGH